MTNADLACRLIARQFPQWAHLPLTPIDSSGTDNHVWRLGRDLCVRMPKAEWAAAAVARECECLPRLQDLPLRIPQIVARGAPDDDYPHVWAVCDWIEGEAGDITALRDPVAQARRLANFVLALRRCDATAGPRPTADDNLRGGPLKPRDAGARAAIANLATEIDGGRAVAIWDAGLAAPEYDGPGQWVHGDLKEGNVLMRDGELAAVIDFGLLAVGDPAVDLTPAWSFFEGPSRGAYLQALAPDAAALTRAKGWAVSVAAIAWDYYRERNPTLTDISRRTLLALVDTV